MPEPDLADPDLSRLLRPRSVVVVGATDRPGSYAAQTLLNLRRAGYPGQLLGVHPRRGEVLGVQCLPTLDAAADRLGSPPDAVVIATPADSVSGYLETAGGLGAGGAVVYAAGFGESGDSAAQSSLVRIALGYGLAVLGPNANGFVSVAARTPLWGDAVTLADHAGPIALVTQSGNVGVLALAHRAGLGLHTVVSLGNAAVIDAAGVLAHLAALRGVRAIALYLEDDGNGARLAAALAACAEADVRVAVLKAGRSAAGRDAVGAHTAALAGDHRVFAALIDEAGGVLTRDPHELLETARALAIGRRTTGRLAVLSASGGDAAIAADLAADAGVPLARFSDATRVSLAELLPRTATVTNPLDHTNLVWADTEALAGLTSVIAGDPDVGPVIYLQDEPSGLPEADAAEWAATRTGAILGGSRAGIETLLVATTPGQEPPAAISGLRAALRAIAALRRPAPDPVRLRTIAACCRSQRPGPDGRWLAEHEAKAVLTGVGIPIPVHVVLPATGPVAVSPIGWPVALKLSAPGLLHKSEAGALALNLSTEAELHAAAVRLLDREMPPGAVLLLERMAEPGVEVVIAALRDGVVPALVIGLGGIWTELLDDVVIIPLPATVERVIEGVQRLRGAPLLTGGRGRPSSDLRVLGEIAHRIGDLLLGGGFSLIEVNPLILSTAKTGQPGTTTTATAVDALARY